jgi:hypothetical protein
MLKIHFAFGGAVVVLAATVIIAFTGFGFLMPHALACGLLGAVGSICLCMSHSIKGRYGNVGTLLLMVGVADIVAAGIILGLKNNGAPEMMIAGLAVLIAFTGLIWIGVSKHRLVPRS